MNHIPVHRLNSNTNIGFEVWHSRDNKQTHKSGIIDAHRDDHYIFLLIEQGNVNFMIDFTEVVISGKSIHFVLPGQVHHGSWSADTQAWFVALDPALIPLDLRHVFENRLLLQQPFTLDTDSLVKFQSLLQLMHSYYHSPLKSTFHLPILHGLMNSFLAMFACGYYDESAAKQSQSRPVKIAHEFKQLLRQNVQQVKSPSAYAALLHLSESYLNEALKKVTGFPVTYWILQEVMLEAKRLLYYSQLTVKEIAHHLGYEDHAYFSRLFKKANQITPLAFRETYRK